MAVADTVTPLMMTWGREGEEGRGGRGEGVWGGADSAKTVRNLKGVGMATGRQLRR